MLGGVGAVHPVVGGHHRPRLRLLDRHLEGRQVDLAQGSLPHLRADRVALELGVVADEVLDAGADVPALHAANVADRDTCGEVGILRVALEVASGQRRAVDVHRRCQQHLGALAARLLGQGHPHALDQLRVPGGGERGAAGEAGGGASGLVPTASGAAGAVGHLDGRDPQARDAGAVPDVRAGEHRDLLLDAHTAEQFIDSIRHGSSAGRWYRKRRREPGGARQPARSAGQVKSASQPVPSSSRSTAARSSGESAARPSRSQPRHLAW